MSKRLTGAAVLLILLAGCSSSPPVQLYQLRAEAPQAAAGPTASSVWALGTVLPLFNGLAHTLAHHGCGVPVSLNFLALGFFAFVLGVHLFSVQKRAVGEQALAWRRSAK